MRSPEGLGRRVLTAALLLGAFLAALLFLDRALFAILVGAVILLAAFEWGRLAGFAPRRAMLYAIGICSLFAITGYLTESGRILLLGLAFPFWLALVPVWLRLGMSGAARPSIAAAGAGALTLAGLAAIALPPLELLLVLGLVWIGDIAAYFAGHAFGRRKLAPIISPGKTWEGVGGAAVATLMYAIICALPGAPLGKVVQGTLWLPYLAGAGLLCGVGIVGDLFESALKRRAGAKDSGSLLPGHGGVLDRLDSVMPTLPIAAVLLHWMPAT